MKNTEASSGSRYRELDLLRGVAILLMICHHAIFYLVNYYNWTIDIHSGFTWAIGRSSVILFLLLVGLCFTISWERTLEEKRWRKIIRRGAIITSLALAITAFTWWMFPDKYIRFGILHLIGLSAFIQPLFHKFREHLHIIGTAWLALGFGMREITVNSSWLFIIGLRPHDFGTLDYYAFFPWFGFILLGMWIGWKWYAPQRHEKLQMIESIPTPRFLVWAGRQSLALYFAHHLILIGILYLLLGSPQGA